MAKRVYPFPPGVEPEDVITVSVAVTGNVKKYYFTVSEEDAIRIIEFDASTMKYNETEFAVGAADPNPYNKTDDSGGCNWCK